MGGHNAGETASRVAVQVMRNLLQGKAPEANALRVGLEAANRRIFDMQRRDPALSGMGTTVTRLWESKTEMLIAHVGDSRAYLYRDGALVCQTQDHMWWRAGAQQGHHPRNGEKTTPIAASSPGAGHPTRREPDVVHVSKQAVTAGWVCSDG
jgi:protein phosphatase